ncbi:paired amphipathic helix protein Sin3b-like [Uloborus diversus]|uniref:paired amphipathic helix protein Sin3b-like n=1 Tax=Uloborus diversus TaxID=327109 RepID=UPI00240961B5|nr:paired amphipathic helix protein Sin3b-like [Uloborus diversus]
MELSEKNSTYKQQTGSVKHAHADAHAQALKILLQDQLPRELTVNEALSYLDLVKSKLGAEQFEEFMDIMGESKKPNCDPQEVIMKVYHLLKYYPELLIGFGMFLPPSMNLMLQTQGQLLFRDSCPEDIYSAEIKIEEGAQNGGTPTVDVKERFEDEPEIHEKFLQLLSSMTEDTATDCEEKAAFFKNICKEIIKLFEKHEDLIEDFKVFLSGAESLELQDNIEQNTSEDIEQFLFNGDSSNVPDVLESGYSFVMDPSAAPVYKYGAYEEHLFFDKVRTALESQEVYDNFLRCLMLFNEDIVTRSELLSLATSFLGRSPGLLKDLKDMLGFNESGENIEPVPMRIITYVLQRNNTEKALDIDYATGGRNGASYRALTKEHKQPKCSGRTSLCKEVLNDIWVSFPSWSEDSTFVTSRKTEYEEMIYRCEDERFELDIAIQANLHTIGVLENVQKRINKMTTDEKSMFALDDTLGGTSTVLHQKALHRIYGDKTDELVEGLKRNPVVAVPIILKRLKAKHDEWKEKQKAFNNIWREQIDNYYMKSLDHQGINFKQNDSKSFRSKSLLNEMEMVYAEKKERLSCTTSLPHFLLELKEPTVFLDALNLICQYLKKIPAMLRDDRRRIEHLLRTFIPDFFGYPRANVSEEENEEEEEQVEEENMEIENFGEERSGHTSPSESGACSRDEEISDPDESNSVEENERSEESDKDSFIEDSDIFDKMESLPSTNLPYIQFLVSKSWYIFFRQFHILCERLSRLLHEGNNKDRTVIKGSSEDGENMMEEIIERKPTYIELITKLGQLLSGTIDYPTFEEDTRSLFGIYAFVSFTMDKLILNIVRQLQQIINDDLCKQLTGLFMQHMKAVSSGGYASAVEATQIEAKYLKKTERLLEEENCFKIMWHKKEHTLVIELIERQNEIIPDPCEVEKFSNYLDDFVRDDSVCEEYVSFFMGLPVFLPRNLKRQQDYWKKKVLYVENLWKTRYSKSFLKRHPPILKRKRKAAYQLSLARRKIACSEPNDDIAVEDEVVSEVNNENIEPVQVNVSDEEMLVDDGEASKVVSTNDEDSSMNNPNDDKDEDNDGENKSVFLLAVEQTEDDIQENVASEILKFECEEGISEETTLGDVPQESSLLFEETNISTLTNDIDLEVFKDDQESMDVDYNSCSSTVSVEKKESSRDSNYSEDNLGSGRKSEGDVVVVIDISPTDGETDVGETNVTIEPAETDVTIEPAEADVTVEPAEAVTVEPAEAVTVEPAEADVTVEPAEADVVVEPAEADVTVEPAEADVTVEPAEADVTVEPAEANVTVESAEADETVETVGEQVDVITVESSFEEDIAIVSDSSVEKPTKSDERDDSKSKTESKPSRPKLSRKAYEGGTRRKSRLHQDYIRRRVKKSNLRSSYSSGPKEKKRKSGPKIPKEYDDISFDFAAFSELPEEDKSFDLAMKSVYVHDDTECSFKKDSYKMLFVQKKGFYMYRNFSLSKAKEIHQQVSEIKTSNFNAWHRVWLDRYVTSAMLKSCNDWLLRSEPEKYKLVRRNINNCTKPPYIPYNKYRLRYYKTET